MSDTAKAFYSATDLMLRYGIAPATLGRWIRNPELGFPQPNIICGQRYFRLSEIEAWESTRPRQALAPIKALAARRPAPAEAHAA